MHLVAVAQGTSTTYFNTTNKPEQDQTFVNTEDQSYMMLSVPSSNRYKPKLNKIKSKELVF